MSVDAWAVGVIIIMAGKQIFKGILTITLLGLIPYLYVNNRDGLYKIQRRLATTENIKKEGKD